jgi:hypothetical protein
MSGWVRRETGKRWTVEVRHGEGVANRTGPEGIVKANQYRRCSASNLAQRADDS